MIITNKYFHGRGVLDCSTDFWMLHDMENSHCIEAFVEWVGLGYIKLTPVKTTPLYVAELFKIGMIVPNWRRV